MSSVDPIEPSPLTFLGSDRRLARRVARPVARFLQVEAAGGVVLLVGTVIALVWANSPWRHSYHEILETHITLAVGGLYTIDLPIEAWINDALMALFFFVVGIEIKRELVAGELRNPRAAALPALAALGGMVVPALIFTAFNLGQHGEAGWGIPMATDIAFALGVVSLLGSRVPSTMKVFLLTLAIVDDIGAIVVIAVFYTADLS
ncbi:MAG: Na+/H+ antiporter NhaA, partial [Actinomyces sp.]